MPLNVQILTTNGRDYGFRYIPVHVTPSYYVKQTDNRNHRIVPKIYHNGDNGIVTPTTPSSFVLTDRHGQVIDNIKLVTTTAVPILARTTAGLPLFRSLILPYHNK